jgi:hypothetical protein
MSTAIESLVPATQTDVTDPAEVTAEREHRREALSRPPGYAKEVVARIVGMIVDGLTTEGERNFAIGKEAYQLAVWQCSTYAQYKSTDFDGTMRNIQLDVRSQVSIDLASIRVASWVFAHVLREQVRAIEGDAADVIPYHEYALLAQTNKRTKKVRALVFDKTTVTGTLSESWLDFIQTLISRRANGERIGSEDFAAMLAKHESKIADSATATPDPATVAARAAADKLQAQSAKVSAAKDAIVTSVSDALAGNLVGAKDVVETLQTVTKGLNVQLPGLTGFNPADASEHDVNTLVAALEGLGKWKIMGLLFTKLGERLTKRRTDQNSATQASTLLLANAG